MEARRYRDEDGHSFAVRCNVFMRGEEWGAYCVRPLAGAKYDIPTLLSKPRATRDEAQADLDAYAQKHGLKEVNDERQADRN